MNARTRRRIAVIKDIGSWVLAWALIGQQALLVPPDQANPAFLWLAGALIGVPGASTALARYRTGTTGSDSSRRRSASPR